MARINRTHAIQVYLTTQELEHFDKSRKLSTCVTKSAYMRKLLLGKPVTVRHRNQSLDDLMTELIPLRAELNSIAEDYRQITGRLHLLRNLGQVEAWIHQHEAAREILHGKITEIKSIISHIDDIWLQK